MRLSDGVNRDRIFGVVISMVSHCQFWHFIFVEHFYILNGHFIRMRDLLKVGKLQVHRVDAYVSTVKLGASGGSEIDDPFHCQHAP